MHSVRTAPLALLLALGTLAGSAGAATPASSTPPPTLAGVPLPCGVLPPNSACQPLTITAPAPDEQLTVPADNPVVTVRGLAAKESPIYAYLLWQGTRVINPREAYRTTTDETGKFALPISFPDTGDFSVVAFVRASIQEHGSDSTFFQMTLMPPVEFHVDVQAPPSASGDLGPCSDSFDLSQAVTVRERPLVRLIPADPDNPAAAWMLTDLGEIVVTSLFPGLSYCMDGTRTQRVIFRSGRDPLLVVRSDAPQTVRVAPRATVGRADRGPDASGAWILHVAPDQPASVRYDVPALPGLDADGPALAVRGQDVPAAIAALLRASGAPEADVARVLATEVAPLLPLRGTYELRRASAASSSAALPLTVTPDATILRTFVLVRPLVGPVPALVLPAPVAHAGARGVELRAYGVVLAD